jgi:hypothetical protein
MFGYDVFNAVSLINIPGAPASTTFKEILQGYPSANSSFGPNRGYTGPDGYVWDEAYLNENNADKNHLDDISDVADLFKWASGSDTGDWAMLYPADAFYISGSDATTSVYQVRYVTNDKNTSHARDYVVNIKKNGSTSGQSIPTAAGSSSVPCFSNYKRDDAGGYAEFYVTLQSADDYMEFDVGIKNSGSGADGDIHASKFVTQCGTWERHDNNEFQDKNGDRIQIKLVSVTANEVSGCTDPLANNTTDNATLDDGSCIYHTASINSFTISPTTVKVGEPITLSWSLSNAKFSKVSIIHNGTDLLAGTGQSQDQSSSITFTPTTVGSNSFKLQVTWDKTNSQTRNLTRTINAQSATSYIQCTDPNRAKDGNGECADCNTGYFLDSTTGLCSQCTDPNRSKNTDGTCGDCLDRYELTAAGICEPVISGGNECADSNRETNSDGSCASSCISGYSFDSSNMCQSDDTTATLGSGGMGMGTIAFFGVIAALSGLAIMG